MLGWLDFTLRYWPDMLLYMAGLVIFVFAGGGILALAEKMVGKQKVRKAEPVAQVATVGIVLLWSLAFFVRVGNGVTSESLLLHYLKGLF